MLRNYQIDICRQTVEAFRSHRSVMVQMPTGTGKTVVLASLVSNEELCSNEDLVLIVAHRRELVEQIKETIRRLGIDNGRIIVESIQAISRRIDSLEFTPSLVVIDEAHHALAKTYRMMWEAWLEAKFLGLTATPCRLNGKGFTDLFEVLLTSHTIGQFIREGWLSLFDYYSIKVDSEDQRIIDSLEKRGADGDYQAKELNEVMNRRPSIERLYESVCRYGEGKKGIVYAVSIEHARNIADYYCCRGIRAVAVSSVTPKRERERILSLFKESSFNHSSICLTDSFENSPVPSYPEEGLHLSLPNPLFPQEREGLSGAPQACRGNGACGPSDLPLDISTQQSCDCFCGSAAGTSSAASSFSSSGAFFENSPVPSYPEERLHLSHPNPLFPQEREGLSGAPQACRGTGACGPSDLPLDFSTQQSCDCFCGFAAGASSASFPTDSIQVLVGVDLFSEGFDCPDVEFIQLARPTLSLAKYLQMVGRGLRKSKGKKTCVMIDNVGLYRMFGLPAADRDWQAMFEGRMRGKGCKARNGNVCNYAMTVHAENDTVIDANLEEIIDHGSLRKLLNCNMQCAGIAADTRLTAFQDKESGLYGLKRGEKITVMPQYTTVFDVADDLAAVKFKNGTTGLVDGKGNSRKILERNSCLRLTGNDILAITGRNNKTRYVDLRNDMEYKSRPTSVWFGSVEMLRIGGRCYCRTKHPYKAGSCNGRYDINDKVFYVDIFMNNDMAWYNMLESMGMPNILHTACILANDDTDWYILSSALEDGSIIILDQEKNYYHVEGGKKKHYIGNELSTGELILTIKRLKEKARKKVERVQVERQERRLMQLQNAEPFRLNNKWGLRVDGRVVVPPVYRAVRPPVGKYCAIEKNYRQWGVVALDGTVMVVPKYADIEISTQGIVTGTRVTGSKEEIRLP